MSYGFFSRANVLQLARMTSVKHCTLTNYYKVRVCAKNCCRSSPSFIFPLFIVNLISTERYVVSEYVRTFFFRARLISCKFSAFIKFSLAECNASKFSRTKSLSCRETKAKCLSATGRTINTFLN